MHTQRASMLKGCNAKYLNEQDLYPWISPLLMAKVLFLECQCGRLMQICHGLLKVHFGQCFLPGLVANRRISVAKIGMKWIKFGVEPTETREMELFQQDKKAGFRSTIKGDWTEQIRDGSKKNRVKPTTMDWNQQSRELNKQQGQATKMEMNHDEPS